MIIMRHIGNYIIYYILYQPERFGLTVNYFVWKEGKSNHRDGTHNNLNGSKNNTKIFIILFFFSE